MDYIPSSTWFSGRPGYGSLETSWLSVTPPSVLSQTSLASRAPIHISPHLKTTTLIRIWHYISKRTEHIMTAGNSTAADVTAQVHLPLLHPWELRLRGPNDALRVFRSGLLSWMHTGDSPVRQYMTKVIRMYEVVKWKNYVLRSTHKWGWSWLTKPLDRVRRRFRNTHNLFIYKKKREYGP